MDICCVALFLAMCTIAFSGGEQDGQWFGTRLSTGFFERPLRGKFPAEAAETVHFVRPLPVFDADRANKLASDLAGLLTQHSHSRMADASAAWKQAVGRLVTKINQVRDAAERPYRGRRGVAALGNVLNWCCDVAVDGQLLPIVENEKRLKSTVQQLVNAHSVLEGDLQHTVGEMRNFSAAVDASLQRLERANTVVTYNASTFYRSWLTQSDVLLHALELQATLEEALADESAFAVTLSSCATNHLSAQLVPLPRLQAAVHALLTRLATRRVRLAVDDVAQLYTAPLAQCSITSTGLHIWVRVPLVSFQEDWRVVEYVPLPFVWKNATCTMFPETILAIRSGNKVAILQGAEERRCRAQSACQVPRVVDRSRTAGCIEAALQGGAVSRLTTECAFSCSLRAQPEVVEVAVDRFVVANPTSQPLRIRCNGQLQSFQASEVAAHFVTVPPHCEAEVADVILVRRRDLAHDNASTVASGEIILPSLWSTLVAERIHDVADIAAAPILPALGAIVDSNWTRRTPRFMTPVHTAVIDEVVLEGVPLSSYRFFPGEEYALLVALLVLFVATIANAWWTSLHRGPSAINITAPPGTASAPPAPALPPTLPPAPVAAPEHPALAARVKLRRSGSSRREPGASLPLLRQATLSYPASTVVVSAAARKPSPAKP